MPERGRIGIFNRSLLRGSARRARPPEMLRGSRLPTRAGDQAHLEGTLRGHHATSRRYLARNGIIVRKFFLHVSKKEQKQALPRAHRRTRQELEILGQRLRRARALGRLHGRLRGHDPPYRHPGRARGMSSPRTTNGSPASWSPRRLSKPWIHSTSSILKLAPGS